MSRVRARLERLERMARANAKPAGEPRIVLELVPVTFDENGDPLDVFEVTYTEDADGEASS